MADTKPPETTKSNPANPSTPRARRRVPMSVPVPRMKVDDIPGFHLHWFKESNVPRAMDAGYEFVDKEEVHIRQLGLGNPSDLSGNTDLGSRVSIVGSAEGPNRGPERAYLMKIREEWYKEDRKLLDERNASIMEAIFGDEKIVGPEGSISDRDRLQYVSTALLNRPVRKAKITNRR